MGPLIRVGLYEIGPKLGKGDERVALKTGRVTAKREGRLELGQSEELITRTGSCSA
jgi:hypothetical protein